MMLRTGAEGGSHPACAGQCLTMGSPEGEERPRPSVALV